MEVTCLICDRFDDCAVKVSSLEDTAKYLLALLTEIDFDSNDVLCFGCLGKVNVSLSFLKMCQVSKKCLQRKQQQQTEDFSDTDEIEIVQGTSFTDMEVLHESEKRKRSERLDKSFDTIPEKTSLESLPEAGIQPDVLTSQKRDIYTDAEDDDVTCEYCFDKFNNSEQRKEHETSHSMEDRPYRCSVCTQHFQTRQTLRTHYEIHLTWTCSYDGCEKTFKTKHEKRTHEFRHSLVRMRGQKAVFFRICYICRQPGHLAAACPEPLDEAKHLRNCRGQRRSNTPTNQRRTPY